MKQKYWNAPWSIDIPADKPGLLTSRDRRRGKRIDISMKIMSTNVIDDEPLVLSFKLLPSRDRSQEQSFEVPLEIFEKILMSQRIKTPRVL